MKIVFACAAALLVSGTVAAAQTPAAPEAKKEKKVCRTDAASVGSRFSKRVCLTEKEWASRRGQGEDATRRFLDQTEREGREFNPYPRPGN
jgi:hypothetical protein